MRQVVQNYRTGELAVEAVPAPTCSEHSVIVRTVNSLVSSGTERSKVELARSNWLGKMRQRPADVQRVLESVRRDGLTRTYQKVAARLDVPTGLGYSSAGVVVEKGARCQRFRVGDRVACAGEGFAAHAEMACVPESLCAAVPEGMAMEKAAFAGVGAIALQAVRLSGASLDEVAVVVGLGLVGLVVAQLLGAAGCRVVGVDPDDTRVGVASSFGVQAFRGGAAARAAVSSMTESCGADVVIIAASATNNGPVRLAGDVIREKGRVVILGAVPAHLPREAFYAKEVDVTISRAFGPGTYDPAVLNAGARYPRSYVRWDASANMTAFMDLMARGLVDVKPLISRHVAFEDAPSAYEALRMGSPSMIGVVFDYSACNEARQEQARVMALPGTQRGPAYRASGRRTTTVGFIGAGNFAQSWLLPLFRSHPRVVLRGVATRTPIHAAHAARKFGFTYATTDYTELLADKEIDAVVIATRHDNHAKFVIESLERGKHVFVEKPLALTVADVLNIAQAVRDWRGGGTDPVLMVGYNRRFAPLMQLAHSFLRHSERPTSLLYRVNAGALPADHWLLDPEQGGGRILGEACHFVDTFQYLTDARPATVFARATGGDNGLLAGDADLEATITFDDGSVASLVYASSGSVRVSRERLEAFTGGRVAVVDNFRSVLLAQDHKKQAVRRWTQDLGYKTEVDAFVRAALSEGDSPALDSLLATSLATIAAVDSLRSGRPAAVGSSDRQAEGLAR